MALRAAALRYDQLTAYDRTLIEMCEAIIASGQYAPGPLILSLGKDATAALMAELGIALPTDAELSPYPYTWTVWIK